MEMESASESAAPATTAKVQATTAKFGPLLRPPGMPMLMPPGSIPLAQTPAGGSASSSQPLSGSIQPVTPPRVEPW
ncbi:MAG: hypothetical protein ACKPKO_05395, partial [Candidatus Fonsibacter sp.]